MEKREREKREARAFILTTPSLSFAYMQQNNPLHSFLCPFVFLANLFFFFRGKVVLNPKQIADLLRCLSLDHVGNRLTAQVQQRLDVHVVGCEDNVKYLFFIIPDKSAIPGLDVIGVAGTAVIFFLVIGLGKWLILVMFTVLDDLLPSPASKLVFGQKKENLFEYATRYIRNGNWLV